MQATTAGDENGKVTAHANNSGHDTPEQPEASQQQAKPKPAPTITVILSEEELWKAFHKVGNEMTVTKPGR